MSAPARPGTPQAAEPATTRIRIDGYPHQLAGHCGSGALRDLRAWASLGWDGPVNATQRRQTDDPALAAAAAAYRGCADAWTRSAQVCRDRPDDHALIAEQAARLPDAERWATDALARAGADDR